jgi:folate-binding protein YgfZ
MDYLNINSRNYQLESSITETLKVLKTDNYFCQLPYLEVIEVIGQQAQSFLQGQLTNDINQVTTLNLQANLLCNLKGQIISQLWVGQAQDYFLICPKDLKIEVITLLAKTAALSKVELKSNPDCKVIGLIEKGQTQLSLSISPPATNYIEKPNLLWHYLNVCDKQVQIYPATARLFLPHHLGLEQQGWINFQKGCYRGQEIIARMHYLGKSKYHLKTWMIKTISTLVPGEAIYNSQQQKIGELVDYCPINDNQSIILCCVKQDFNEPNIVVKDSLLEIKPEAI